ncbi:acyl-CoA thioesterase [Nocardia terpenica]|uniref:Acyl-CoA thioesterase n=1 Tax=Nocardia terpenica TaxID=455432 RepID=A0A6G9Z1B5_9NOCA|nr:thioesterase family protein [Nocardia terpenica]QIS18793.1 acyl-CoA thioesterase [Nocardia terpenica]
MGFTHRVRVRYGDCDMQGVVFNANYLGFVDDAMDVWLRGVLGENYTEGFDYAVKKAGIEWVSPARHGEEIEVSPEVIRWGRTSFDVGVRLDVGDRAVCRAELTFVCIDHDSYRPIPVPEHVRAALS